MKKVQLGCGNNRFPGWTNVDLEPGADIIMDLSKGNLPFASGEIDFIYSEHFIEHITREQGIALFVECARTLKAGGTMRLSTIRAENWIAGRLLAGCHSPRVS
jgi:predicted SAM-dependent methyltransferase